MNCLEISLPTLPGIMDGLVMISGMVAKFLKIRYRDMLLGMDTNLSSAPYSYSMHGALIQKTVFGTLIWVSGSEIELMRFHFLPF
jgi:hypothetical protein